VSASEEPHRVAESLTITLSTAYMGYKNNLEALDTTVASFCRIRYAPIVEFLSGARSIPPTPSSATWWPRSRR